MSGHCLLPHDPATDWGISAGEKPCGALVLGSALCEEPTARAKGFAAAACAPVVVLMPVCPIYRPSCDPAAPPCRYPDVFQAEDAGAAPGALHALRRSRRARAEGVCSRLLCSLLRHRGYVWERAISENACGAAMLRLALRVLSRSTQLTCCVPCALLWTGEVKYCIAKLFSGDVKFATALDY